MTNTAVAADNALPFSGLARKLVSSGLLSEHWAREAQDQAHRNNISLVAHLVDNDILNAYTIAETGAYEFGAPLFDITTIDQLDGQ